MGAGLGRTPYVLQHVFSIIVLQTRPGSGQPLEPAVEPPVPYAHVLAELLDP